MIKTAAASALVDLSSLMRRTVTHTMLQRKGESLPPAQMSVLVMLMLNGPMRMSELAARTHTSRPNLTMLVERLFRDGYVQRSRSDGDRRQVVIELTQLSLDRVDEINERILHAVGEELEGYTQQELDEITEHAQALEKLLTKLDNTMQ